MFRLKPYLELAGTHQAVDLVGRREHRGPRARGVGKCSPRQSACGSRTSGNWTERQRVHFAKLRVDILKVGGAWAIREAFAGFWKYHYAASARKYFDCWRLWARHSRLAPIISAACRSAHRLHRDVGHRRVSIKNESSKTAAWLKAHRTCIAKAGKQKINGLSPCSL